MSKDRDEILTVEDLIKEIEESDEGIGEDGKGEEVGTNGGD